MGTETRTGIGIGVGAAGCGGVGGHLFGHEPSSSRLSTHNEGRPRTRERPWSSVARYTTIPGQYSTAREASADLDGPFSASQGGQERLVGAGDSPYTGPVAVERASVALAGSPVGVSGPSTVAHRPQTALPRRPVWSEYVDDRHGAVAEPLVEAAYDGGREQLHLSGPRRRVGPDQELAVGEGLR